MEEHNVEYHDKSSADKLSGIARNAPMVPIGLVALVAIVGHGIYKFRSRKIRPSLYLINYRLAAQGTFLGCITLGLAYTVFKEHVWKRIRKE